MKYNTFAALLCLIFITLKLVGVITWSWWWVLAPLWVMPAIFILFILGVFTLNLFDGGSK